MEGDASVLWVKYSLLTNTICVTLVVSCRLGLSPKTGTKPVDTKVPVNGKNAVTSQITATADLQYA
jgi:hypothetical protein